MCDVVETLNNNYAQFQILIYNESVITFEGLIQPKILAHHDTVRGPWREARQFNVRTPTPFKQERIDSLLDSAGRSSPEDDMFPDAYVSAPNLQPESATDWI